MPYRRLLPWGITILSLLVTAAIAIYAYHLRPRLGNLQRQSVEPKVMIASLLRPRVLLADDESHRDQPPRYLEAGGEHHNLLIQVPEEGSGRYAIAIVKLAIPGHATAQSVWSSQVLEVPTYDFIVLKVQRTFLKPWDRYQFILYEVLPGEQRRVLHRYTVRDLSFGRPRSDLISIMEHMHYRGLDLLTVETAKATYFLACQCSESANASYFGIGVRPKAGRSWHGVDGAISAFSGGNYPIEADGVIDQAGYDTVPRLDFDRRPHGSQGHAAHWEKLYPEALADVGEFLDARR